MVKSDVFNRTTTEASLISTRAFNILVGLVVSWGFAVNWLMVTFIPVNKLIYLLHSTMGDFKAAFVIWALLSCVFGTYLYKRVNEPIISFIGYNFIVVPIGLILILVVSTYSKETCINAIQITVLVSVVMIIFGVTFPEFFNGTARIATFALLVFCVIQCVDIFYFQSDRKVWDWIITGLLCLRIGYDWGRANNIPKTVDNAVDSGAAMYVTIINLFLRILRIFGKKN